MNSPLTISINAKHGTLTGPLNRDTVASLEKNKHIKMLKGAANNLTLNLAELTHVDTAGLAWLLLLLETAEKLKSQLTFVQVPNDLLKLAKLSDVDTFLVN